MIDSSSNLLSILPTNTLRGTGNWMTRVNPRGGLTNLQISASRASAPELPEPVGAEQAEDVPKLEGFTED